MNDDNEQRENENLVQPPKRQQQREKINRGKKILIGSFFVTAFLMVVIAFIMSAVAISRSDDAISQSDYAISQSDAAISQSDTAISRSDAAISQMPVKYTTYERIGSTKCPIVSGTSLIYTGITISYSFNSTQNTLAFDACLLITKILTIIRTTPYMKRISYTVET